MATGLLGIQVLGAIGFPPFWGLPLTPVRSKRDLQYYNASEGVAVYFFVSFKDLKGGGVAQSGQCLLFLPFFLQESFPKINKGFTGFALFLGRWKPQSAVKYVYLDFTWVSIELLSNTRFLFLVAWKAFDGKLHTLLLWWKQLNLFTVACKAIVTIVHFFIRLVSTEVPDQRTGSTLNN